MSEIPWPKGVHFNHFKKQVEKHSDAILNGTILAIDPASIRLGWAVAESGEVTGQGTIELDQKAEINHRLQDIVATLQKDKEYDVMSIEMIRGKMAHIYLKMSCGAIIGATKAPVCIEVPIQTWQRYALHKFGYTKIQEYKDKQKSDDMDSVMMAETLITLAQELKNEK